MYKQVRNRAVFLVSIHALVRVRPAWDELDEPEDEVSIHALVRVRLKNCVPVPRNPRFQSTHS